FEVTNTGSGGVAIDDVLTYDGPCPNTEEVCDFESADVCGYEVGAWKVNTALYFYTTTGVEADVTTGTEQGHYIHVDATPQTNASLVSPIYKPTSGRCLKFYYRVYGNIKDTFALLVSLRQEGGNEYLIDRFLPPEDPSEWSFGEVNVVSGRYFQIVFDSNHLTGNI
ncbi:hypothetical protein EGW08_004492, partial [Elysia chlorotica]